MKTCFTFILLVLASVVGADPGGGPQLGEVVFQTGFHTPAEKNAWSPAEYATWEAGHRDGASLCIKRSPGQVDGGHMVSRPLDLSRYRGCQLIFECMAKADGVSKPSASYLGVKFMLHYQSKADGPCWINQNEVHGSFDWRPLRFSARIAPDATDGMISLGLQDSSGTVWFDTVKITVLKRPVVRPSPPEHPSPVFKGHDLPRLRGVMSPNVFRDEDMRVLGREWNANVIRWQLTRNWGRSGTDRDLAEYDRWMQGRLDELDQALASCLQYGIKVVVDMHSPPGGRYPNNDLAIFNEVKYQDHFVALWEQIARRYQGHAAIWGYDLINEPVQDRPSPPGVADYLGTQVRAAKAIRAIDDQVPVFIEACQWDSAAGFRELEPVPLSNIVYQVHMYVPGSFTHQGVHGTWTPTTYPGEINHQVWDKDRLRTVLQPVREFQRAYNVHIYVGEFSAIRWAPGAADYLRDCIDLFEEYGWDWTYHAYREWDGWSVEHGSDPDKHQPSEVATDRKTLLLHWFGKNEKPSLP